MRAIQWNLHYYYNGCVSWSWFYPHHYSPWITDIKDFASMDLAFDKGTPFLPFEQLMAVLPLASKKCIPEPLQWLMMAKESPIIDFYPLEFEQDLNGKQQEWEAVVCIPFIDQVRLLERFSPRGEKVVFAQPCQAVGNLEDWLHFFTDSCSPSSASLLSRED